MLKTQYFCAISFILFLGIAVFLAAMAHTPLPIKENIMDGRAAQKYEEEFDQNLAHRKSSISFWNNATYQLFKEGKKGVLIGEDGWLFTDEEFSASDYFDQNKETILSVFQKFSEKNIKLLVVVLPSKARIYQDKLGKYQFPSYWENQYQEFLNFLTKNKIAAIDLKDVFEKNKEQNIYLKTDTHWTPLGARLAALKAGYMVQSRWPYLSWENKSFHSLKGEVVEHEGDLLRYTVQGEDKDSFYTWKTEEKNPANDNLFGDIELPVTLVGTSYSANKLWNFEGFLKESLAADILNVADEGLGPFEVMDNYLDRDPYKKTPPKLVIWEIPERYLAVNYEGKKK